MGKSQEILRNKPRGETIKENMGKKYNRGEGGFHARDVMVGFTSTLKQSVELSEGAGPEAALRLPTAGGVRGVTAGVGGSWFAGVDTKAVRSRGRDPAPKPPHSVALGSGLGAAASLWHLSNRGGVLG